MHIIRTFSPLSIPSSVYTVYNFRRGWIQNYRNTDWNQPLQLHIILKNLKGFDSF